MNTKNVSLNDKPIEKPHILYDLCRKELKYFKINVYLTVDFSDTVRSLLDLVM